MKREDVIYGHNKKINSDREILEKQIEKMEKAIAVNKAIAGGDELACGLSHGVSHYLINKKYVSKKEMKRITLLAQLDYDKKKVIELKRKKNAVENVLKFYSVGDGDRVFDSLTRGRREIITPICIPREQFVREWLSEKYEQYDRWDDVKTEIYTINGERVRSKAEKIIADELTAYGVPYKYEYPLKLVDGRQERILRPDFIALNCRLREEFVIEHLGMMDKLGYNNANLNKLDIYERNGFLLGVNMLIFHETSENQLSISVVRRYIEEYLI